MFDLFRSRAKAVKIMLGSLLMLVAISMVVTLIPGWGTGYGDEPQVVAEIGDQTLTVREVQLAVQTAFRNRGLTPELAGVMVPQMVEQMVTQRALALQAERMGLRVSEDEVVEYIRRIIPQLFPQGKFVGREVYAAFLEQQNMTIPEFEQRVRQEALVNKLRRLATEGIVVADAEIEKAFRRRNEKVMLEYAALTPDRYRAQVSVTPGEIKSHFEARRAAFRRPETRSFDVLLIEQSKVAEAFAVSEEQLRQVYQQNLDRYRTQERVRARHILLKTTGKSEAEVKAIQAKAEDLLKQLRGGADFAALAKQHSEDPGSAAKGGDLDWITRGQTVPVFEQAAFSLKPNELSNVIKTEYGFHIVQVLEKAAAGVRPFEEVKASIAEESKLQGVYERMQELADRARAELLKDPRQGKQLAEQLKIGFTPVSNYQPGQPIAQMGTGAEVREAVAGLNAGEVTSVIQFQNAAQNVLAVAAVTDVQPARPSELSEVEAAIRTTLENEKAAKLVEEKAQQLLKQAQAAGDLKKAAQAMGLELKQTQAFSRDGAADGIGTATYVEQAFSLEIGAIFGPVTVGPQKFVCRVGNKTPADMTQLAAQREQIQQQIRSTLARTRLELFEEGIRTHLINHGKIKINQRVVNNLVSSYRG